MEKIERNYLKQYKFQDYRFYYTLSALRKNLLGSLKVLSWSLKNGWRWEMLSVSTNKIYKKQNKKKQGLKQYCDFAQHEFW